jgi:nucleoside-triphosphatase THEP1
MLVRIVTGPVNGGKSTLLRILLDRELEKGRSAGGFLTIPVRESPEGRKSGFMVELLPGRSVQPIAGTVPQQGSTGVGRFHLYREGLEAALDSVLCSAGADITVLDEIGPAELAGEGHSAALELALGRRRGEVWISLRETLLEPFLEYLGAFNCDVLVEQPFFAAR